LDPAAIDRYVLEESTNEGANMIVAPLRADLQVWADTYDRLRTRVVNSLLPDRETGATVAEAVHRRLTREVAALGQAGAEAPLPYNYVRDFPLTRPGLMRLFHVYRRSVRGLLHTFERNTGAHLWCSIRRSGKTTAGFDLNSTTEAATVVSQTCDSTGERAADDLFYRRFLLARDNALSGKHLSPSFFIEAVRAVIPDKQSTDRKVVFILDEYETLFGQLRLAEDDPNLRYCLVQPLLNQMVAFSREHLLVLLGMRPDAHFVLMEQNQFSPCVVQDQFPLFTHAVGGGQSEFRELLQKAVRMSAADLDAGFCDAMYAETGGHPYLTVNLLFEVFEWLIRIRRPARGLRLTEADYRAFAADGLTAQAVVQTSTYDFMRGFVQRALSDSTRRQDPWLYSVFTLLRHLGRESPDSFALPRGQAADLIRRHGLISRAATDPDHLLRTAGQANVFQLDGEHIRPRIPLLARLALSIPDVIEA
jgi:hypothetical protein